MRAKSKTITLTVTIALLTLFISNVSLGQETVAEKTERDVRGYLMFGGSRLDIDALNERLVSKGYSSFSDEFATIGIGFLNKSNSRWLFGLEGHVLFVERKDNVISNVGYRTSLTAFNGFFDVGYDLVSLGGLYIYPLIGIGGGGAWLQIGKNNFNDILEEPKGNTGVFSGTFMLNFAIGTDYQITMKESKGNEGGFVLGFRVGYAYALWKGGWWTDINSIDGGPKTGLTGPYLRLNIGFGGKGDFWNEANK